MPVPPMIPMSALFAMIGHQRLDLVAHLAQPVRTTHVRQFNNECKAGYLAAKLFYQLRGSSSRPACCYKVVGDQYVFAFAYRVLLELHRRTAVFNVIGPFQGFARQLASLADHHYALAKL